MASTRGILRPRAGLEHFELDRAQPPDDLHAIVGALWTVRWDLPGGTTFRQEILPFPNVNLAFEDSTLNVHGPTKARFVAQLRGRGWVAGVRFRPAGFFAVATRPMREVVESVVRAERVTGKHVPPFPADPVAARTALLAYVRSCRREVDWTELEAVNAWVERAQVDRNIATAADLARLGGVSVRTMHRTLQQYVGVSCKWIVRRARIQQCADLVSQGKQVAWARVAQELGYHDQAHLIRDFKAQIGLTPAAYAAQCGA